MADSLKVNYFETSALNGTGINEAFESLTKLILKKKLNANGRRTISLSSQNEDNTKKGCC